VIEILPNIADVTGHRHLKLFVSGFQSKFWKFFDHCQNRIVFGIV